MFIPGQSPIGRGFACGKSTFQEEKLAVDWHQSDSFYRAVLLAEPGRDAEVLKFIAEDKLDFVARVDDFAPLVLGVLPCRLRGVVLGTAALHDPDQDPTAELAEIFRHEIHTPRPGILGNAERLLAQEAHLKSAGMQRVQTVVNRAVRRRETTRRVSDAIESGRDRCARRAVRI